MNSHRYKNDFHDFNIVSNVSRCELGQLTVPGFEQILQNSRILAHYYGKLIDQLEDNQIETFSTNSFRTFQSSIAFLFAFLPNHLFGKVVYQIHESPSSNFCFNDCICNKIDNLRPKVSIVL